MYKPKHFKAYEIVPQALFLSVKSSDFLFTLFDDRILKAADLLREMYGAMIANTWYWGGSSQYRGFRPYNCMTGAEFSQHKYGRALDLIPRDTPVDQVRSSLIAEPMVIGGLVTCVEKDVSWLHIDCRNHNIDNGLKIIGKRRLT